MIPAAQIIPLFVIIPLGGAFIISMIGRRVKRMPEIVATLTTISLLVCAFFALRAINIYGILVYSVGAWKAPIGINMVLDGLSSFMLVTVNLAVCIISIYALSYMERFTSPWKFFTLFLLMLGGMNGVLITGDIFNLFVFLEIAAIASFVRLDNSRSGRCHDARFKP